MTAHLITVVSAIILLVASPIIRNALGIMTLEGVRRALCRLRTVLLIPAIGTIPLPVTEPTAGNAAPGSALKVLFQTLFRSTTLLINSIGTILISVTFPQLGNANTRSTSPFISTARNRWAIFLVLSVRTIPRLVTTFVRRDTESRAVRTLSAAELRVEAGKVIAIHLIGSVQAISDSVADQIGSDARLVLALELSWSTVEWRTVWRLIRVVTAIILCVTAPVEGNAFERGMASEMRRRAIVQTRPPIVA